MRVALGAMLSVDETLGRLLTVGRPPQRVAGMREARVLRIC